MLEKWLDGKNAQLYSQTRGPIQVFGPTGRNIKSMAMLRLSLGADAPTGALVFGARNPETFDEGQGTELISFLSQVVERLITSWLNLQRAS